jgi:hypothetical protein
MMTIVVVFFLSSKEIHIEKDNDNNVSSSFSQAKEKKKAMACYRCLLCNKTTEEK